MLMIKEYWNLIDQEPFLAITWEIDFSQAYSFDRMLRNHNNFHFTQIPDKNNDLIFDGNFFQKNWLCHTQLYKDSQHHAQFQKKLMSQSWENVRRDRRMDGQILFYRTLPAEAGGPTISLQQVTGGNTPNLVLKRMLRYFLKIPPLKKILKF